MVDYDSDSSDGGNDIETNVLLGYASKEETSDEFSQLGGRPTWLDTKSPPSGALGKCNVCNGASSLMLQLNANLAERFPAHERRMYVFGCRKKTCRRKEGSIRALRAVRPSEAAQTGAKGKDATNATNAPPRKPDLGEALFGAKSPTVAQANPFASPSSAINGQSTNPFANSKPAPTENKKPTPEQAPASDELPQSFAEKVRISSSSSTPQPETPPQPWQDDRLPYPSYHLDADKEYLEAEPEEIPSTARLDNSAEGAGGSAADEKAAFESSMDKTFQRFADRLAQNPEQVLRYEFGGEPLLYSKDDKVGKRLAPLEAGAAKLQVASTSSGSKVPTCVNCGAARVFEMQLTPHIITELEADDMSVDGMDWGTIIVGSCVADCQEKGRGVGEVGYIEEWVGVQWEEVADVRKK